MQFPVAPVVWPSSGLRRASVNSFGFGGSNCHAILDDPYHFLPTRGLSAQTSATDQPSEDTIQYINGHMGNGELDLGKDHLSRKLRTNETCDGGHLPNGDCDDTIQQPRLLVWSTADKQALYKMLTSYDIHFSRVKCEDSIVLDDLAYTLAARRSVLPWRSFATALDTSKIKTHASEPQRMLETRGLAFLFTGQGAQYEQMGSFTLRYDVFYNTIRRFDTCLQDLGCKWSLLGAWLPFRALQFMLTGY